MPLEKIVANVEFEMIGRPDPKVAPRTLWLTGYERSDLGAVLASRGARLVQDPHPDQNFFQRSDNYTLAIRGVVAHTVSSYGLHKEYHTPADETKLVDYAHMTESIASMVEPLWWLANTTFKPAWKPGKRAVNCSSAILVVSAFSGVDAGPSRRYSTAPASRAGARPACR